CHSARRWTDAGCYFVAGRGSDQLCPGGLSNPAPDTESARASWITESLYLALGRGCRDDLVADCDRRVYYPGRRRVFAAALRCARRLGAGRRKRGLPGIACRAL